MPSPEDLNGEAKESKGHIAVHASVRSERLPLAAGAVGAGTILFTLFSHM